MLEFLNAAIHSTDRDGLFPLATLAGIVALFAAVVLTGFVARERGFGAIRLFFLFVFGTVSIGALLLMFWLNAQEAYGWVNTRYVADWAGEDEGWTGGKAPTAKCDAGNVGQIAVCWSNRRGGYPADAQFQGTGTPGAWCTYKKVEARLGAASAASPGVVHVCARLTRVAK